MSQIVEYRNDSKKTVFWKLIGVLKAAYFAWKYPRHVMITIKNEKKMHYDVRSRYNGMTEDGYELMVMDYAYHIQEMRNTSESLKDILNTDNND